MVNQIPATMTSQPSTVAASPGVTFTPRQMLWKVAKQYPFKIMASVVMGFSGAFFNGVGTALVVPIMLSLLGQDAILRAGPAIFRILLTPFEELPETYRYVAMASAALLLIILKNVTNYLSGLASGTLSGAMTSDLQRQRLDMILSVDLEYFSKAQASELMNRVGSEMNRFTSANITTIRLLVTIDTIFVFLGLMLPVLIDLLNIRASFIPSASETDINAHTLLC